MNHPVRPLFFSILLPLFAVGAEALSVRENLLSRPPFGASRSPAPAPRPTETPAPGATELRGIFGRGESCEVSLRRGGPTGETRWIKVGDSFGSWRVVSVDADLREAVVEVDGNLQTLPLAKPDSKPIPVISPPHEAAVAPPRLNGVAPQGPAAVPVPPAGDSPAFEERPPNIPQTGGVAPVIPPQVRPRRIR